MPQETSHRVVLDPVLSDPKTDGRDVARALAETLDLQIGTILDELRKVTAQADISFIQRSAFQETDSLLTQARYMLTLAKKK